MIQTSIPMFGLMVGVSRFVLGQVHVSGERVSGARAAVTEYRGRGLMRPFSRFRGLEDEIRVPARPGFW